MHIQSDSVDPSKFDARLRCECGATSASVGTSTNYKHRRFQMEIEKSTQFLDSSFSAVSTPIFAINDSCFQYELLQKHVFLIYKIFILYQRFKTSSNLFVMFIIEQLAHFDRNYLFRIHFGSFLRIVCKK